VIEISTSNCLLLAIVFRAQPDDGHHDAPKHVVVASPIASYIIKLVVVIDCCPPIYAIFTHHGNVKHWDNYFKISNVWAMGWFSM